MNVHGDTPSAGANFHGTSGIQISSKDFSKAPKSLEAVRSENPQKENSMEKYNPGVPELNSDTITFQTLPDTKKPRKELQDMDSDEELTQTSENEYTGGLIMDDEYTGGLIMGESDEETYEFTGEMKMGDEAGEYGNTLLAEMIRKGELNEEVSFKSLDTEREARDERFKDPTQKLTLKEKFSMDSEELYRAHKSKVDAKKHYGLIKLGQQKIEEEKERFRPIIEEMQKNSNDPEAVELLNTIQNGDIGEIGGSPGGACGAHKSTGESPVIVKACGAGSGEIHNASGNAALFDTCRLRDMIPNYQTVRREVASRAIAVSLNLEHITPPTVPAFIRSPNFSDITDRLHEEELKELNENGIQRDEGEKLCSVQKFIPGCHELDGILNDQWGEEIQVFWKEKGSSEEKFTFELYEKLLPEFFKEKVKFEDVEHCNLLMWITGENDGHKGNFLVTPPVDGKHGLLKIDNGLTFSEKNQDFVNNLLPLHIHEELSSDMKSRIRELDTEGVTSILEQFHLQKTIKATEDRINVLKKTIQEAEAQGRKVTYGEINYRMKLLAEEGFERASSELTAEDQGEIFKFEKPNVRTLTPTPQQKAIEGKEELRKEEAPKLEKKKDRLTEEQQEILFKTAGQIKEKAEQIIADLYMKEIQAVAKEISKLTERITTDANIQEIKLRVNEIFKVSKKIIAEANAKEIQTITREIFKVSEEIIAEANAKGTQKDLEEIVHKQHTNHLLTKLKNDKL